MKEILNGKNISYMALYKVCVVLSVERKSRSNRRTNFNPIGRIFHKQRNILCLYLWVVSFTYREFLTTPDWSHGMIYKFFEYISFSEGIVSPEN
jgi:hypothetical protein